MFCSSLSNLSCLSLLFFSPSLNHFATDLHRPLSHLRPPPPPPFPRRLRLLSRRERSGVSVWGHQSVRHHQTEDQRVVSCRPTHSPRQTLLDGDIWSFNRRKGGRGGGAGGGVRLLPRHWGYLFEDVDVKRTEWHGVCLLGEKKGRKKKPNNKGTKQGVHYQLLVVCPADMMSTVLSLASLWSDVLHCSRSSLSEWTSPSLSISLNQHRPKVKKHWTKV